MNIINILGININSAAKGEILAKIKEYLADNKQRLIITVNPEMILAAGRDREFFDILNKADLALPDGVGLKIAGWFLGKNLFRITGADLVKDIMRLAEEQGGRVAVFNWRGGLSGGDDIKEALIGKYPKLEVLAVGVERGTEAPEGALARAREFKPEIIFSTLGAPYQEKFIFHNLKNLPSVKIGLGVGGAFDFLTGKIKRAPKTFRLAGLEWLWRLVKQPRRLKRIYNAVVVFPVKFLIWRLKKIKNNL